MYTETANLMQASSVSGGFAEIRNKNLSSSESRKKYIFVLSSI